MDWKDAEPVANGRRLLSELPSRPRAITDLVAEARAIDWDFATWCYVSRYDAADPDIRNMFECLLAYAKREGRAGLH